MRARLAFVLAGFGVAIACGSNGNKFGPTDGGNGGDGPTFGLDGFAPTDGN